MIRVLVVEGHALVRAGLCRLLEAEEGLAVVGRTGSGREGIELCRSLLPDVALIDYGLPDIDGLEATQQIAALEGDTRVLLLTMHANEEYAIRILRAGAAGFVAKGADPEELLAAIRRVADHGTYVSSSILERMIGRIGRGRDEVPEAALSNRELQVLIRLSRGATTREVSAALSLSPSTIETYRSRLLDKLKLRNNSDLTRFALRRRLIALD